MTAPQLSKALLRLSDFELVDLATKRAYLSARFRVPPAPQLANVVEGELARRSTLSLHQASILLCSALQLKRSRDVSGSEAATAASLRRLGQRSAESKDAAAAIQLLRAHAQCYGAEAPEETRRLCLELAQLSIEGLGSTPRLLAEPLGALERMRLEVPQRILESAAQHLAAADCDAAGFAVAAVRLWRSGARMEEVFARVALQLRSELFWWRYQLEEEDARSFRERSIRDLMATRADSFNRALWDVGVVQELQKHIDSELANPLEAEEVSRLLRLMDHLTLLRAHRPPMWRAFMSALLGSRGQWPQEHCVETLPLMMGILRRSPFQALVPSELIHHATAHAGRSIAKAEAVELASMLFSWERLLPPSAFREALCHHQDALRARLDENSAVMLCALAKGGRSSLQMPPWWRKEVLRPWCRQLRRLHAALQGFAAQGWGRARYAQELLGFQVADLGLAWQEPMLRALGFDAAPASFVRSATREVLRQRRQTDASSPSALRALGVLSWKLQGGTVVGRKLVFTGARNMIAEKDADKLLSIDLGHVGRGLARPYRRHGDVERVALLEMMTLAERCTEPGTVQLFVDRAICLSCLGVLSQFRAKVPGVKVSVGSFGPGSFSRPPALSRMVGQQLRDDALDTSLASEEGEDC